MCFAVFTLCRWRGSTWNLVHWEELCRPVHVCVCATHGVHNIRVHVVLVIFAITAGLGLEGVPISVLFGSM